MLRKRAISAATTTLLIAGMTTAIAVPSWASSGSSPQDLADAARAAATGADDAFIAAHWDDVEAKVDDFDEAYAALLAARDAYSAYADEAYQYLNSAEIDRDNAQDALADANVAAAEAEEAHDAAVAAYNAGIGSSLGLPSSWTSLNPNPVKISDLPAAMTRTETQIATATATVATRQAAYDVATGLARIAARVALLAAQAQLAGLQAGLALLQQGYTNLNGPALAQAVSDTSAALDEAIGAAEDAEDALAEAEELLVLREEYAASEQAALDAIDDLIAGLADAVQSVADRRADLADLDTVKRTVVWTLGADNETPKAGDTVKLTFTVPNSELFALSGAKVKVVTPKGITPTCDIVGGVVAAGALVTCTANYVPTDADAIAGKVVFEVELTGYLPLGPGNPRATAATQTLITVNESITVPVAARAAAEVDHEGDGELAQTGLGSAQLGAFAAGLIAAGGALLVVRRRFADAEL